MSDSTFVGRLPLFDNAHRTVAYELVVSDGTDDHDPFDDREVAVRRLLGIALHTVGLDEFVGGRDVWVPVTLRLLEEGHYGSLPPKRTVLQVTPAVCRTEGIAGELDRAHRAGYRVAYDLSSFGHAPARNGAAVSHERNNDGNNDENNDGNNDTASAFACADGAGVTGLLLAVKVNVSGGPGWQALAGGAAARSLTTVAVGVDSAIHHASCASSVNLTQGSFVFEPPVDAQAARMNRMAAMELIAELERPSASFEDVERIISRDPSLTMQILTLANSGLFSLPKRIDSARAALVMLGLSNVRHMALLMTLKAVDEVPPELTVTALVRARQCELLAKALKLRTEVGFTVGLLSLIGVFAGLPNAEALARLPITAEVRNAVEHHEGPLGVILGAVVQCERAEPGGVHAATGPGAPHLPLGLLASTYIEAIRWAERLRGGSVRAPSAGA